MATKRIMLYQGGVNPVLRSPARAVFGHDGALNTDMSAGLSQRAERHTYLEDIRPKPMNMHTYE